METPRRLRAGMIGYGVGKIHASALANLHYAYPDLPGIELVALATATEASARRGIEHLGFQRAGTDYRELLESGDLDLVVIASPPDLHVPMMDAALTTRLGIYIDKPLARSLEEARAIWRRARSLGRDAQMSFQFRHVPALYRARDLIGEGRLGELYSFRAAYMRSSYIDPLQPLRWKGSRERAGSGSLNDTAPHALDLLTWLVGPPVRLAAQMRTFVTDRPVARGSAERTPIDTDDHVILLAAMPNQAIGTIEAGRMVAGSVHDLGVELHGSRASVRWNLMDANHLYLAEARAPGAEMTWEQIPTFQRYPGAAMPGWDVPLGMMRFYTASVASFVRSLLAGQAFDPGLEQGVRVQALVEAARRAAESSLWEDVEAPG
jgi:predicted dehydrogenase